MKYQLRESHFTVPGTYKFEGVEIRVDDKGYFELEGKPPLGLTVFARFLTDHGTLKSR